MNPTYLTANRDLVELCERARSEGRLAFDTEFHRERRYFPKLALLQLATSAGEVLVDPLAGFDLGPMDEVIADPDVVKVAHAPLQDLEIFFLRSARPPRNVFDTQLAAAMLGMGGQIALGGLVHALTGVRLAKGAAFSDWLSRPLSPKQERYAADDVRYLLPMHDQLLERLRECGREAWLAEELARYERPELYATPPDELYRKVKRFRSLDERGQAVLRELAIWRDETARARDRNRRAVLADEVMVELARARPADARALGRIRGLHPREVERSADAILAAVERGQALPEAQLPRVSRGRAPEPSVELATAIVAAFLKAHCAQASIDSTLVATTADVEALVAANAAGSLEERESPLLTGWRGELVGAQVLEFLRGRIAVRLDPDSQAPVFEPYPPPAGVR